MSNDRRKKQTTATPETGVRSDDAYTVGYGQPPLHTRFKKGQSGNPKGRPKGSKSEESIFKELLGRKITIVEKGRRRSITVLEGIILKASEAALKGDLKATTFILNRIALWQDRQPSGEMNDDDSAVFQSFLQKVIRDPKNGGTS